MNRRDGSVRLSASAPQTVVGATARPSRSARREGWQPDYCDGPPKGEHDLTLLAPPVLEMRS
jgi:hypothetical protein